MGRARLRSPENESRISYSPEQDWFGEPRFTHTPRARSRALRWLVVLVVLGMLGVAGATVGRKYVMMAIRPSPAPPADETRVDGLLDEGEWALAEGDLETAKESFDKASALAERDPRVLIDLARLDAVRADFDWLKVRLLASDKGDTLAIAKRQAQQSAQRALRQSNKAADVAPDDPRVARTKIDALRLNGEAGAARMLVARVGQIATQPETALRARRARSLRKTCRVGRRCSIGSSRLRRASKVWRERAARLIYALVRSGDVRQAKGELEKLSDTAAHPFPLLHELKEFVGHAGGDKTPEVDAGKRATPAASTPVAEAHGAPVAERAAARARQKGRPAAISARSFDKHPKRHPRANTIAPTSSFEPPSPKTRATPRRSQGSAMSRAPAATPLGRVRITNRSSPPTRTICPPLALSPISNGTPAIARAP